jgi:PH (Pleckstrin Homology) domain-containing protein
VSSAVSLDEPLDVRPRVMSRIAYCSAAFVLVAFVVTAAVMPHAASGAHFGVKDQAATAVIGVILAGLLLMPSRPRLHADRDGLRLRNFLGGWRTVPWDVVLAVEFPAKVRFARLVLPADETLAVYAVQRLDKQQAIEAMRRLRALHAASRR